MLSGVMRILLAPVLAAALAGPPPAGLNLATAPDGSLEVHDGAQVVARVALKTPALRRGTPALREVAVQGHRVAELRVPVRGSAGAEVWVGELDAPRRVLWSGVTGARDADGETSIWVETTAERVVEYQTAAQVDRCDGAPARLFPRAYDFAAGRFRPIVSTVPAAAPKTLIARRGDPAMPAGRPLPNFRFVGASTTRGAGADARDLTAPVELNDADPATVWAEGLGGDGRGEFLTARAAATGYAVRGIRIFPGDGSSLTALRAHNRVKRLQIAFGPAPEQRFDVEIADDPAASEKHWREPYWVAFPAPLAASCLTAVITEVTPGTEAAPPRSLGTTAIAELSVFTDADGPGGAERLVADLAAAPDCAARLPLLLGLGDAALLPTAQAVASSSGAGRDCLLDALGRLEPTPHTPAVLDALVGALMGSSEDEERVIAATLARSPAPPVAALTALLGSGSASPEDRGRAARVLGGLNDDGAATALLQAAGDGSPALRSAIVGALQASPRLPADALLAAYAAAPRSNGGRRAADLARVLAAVVKAAPAKRAQVLAALRADLAADRPFELRARAILALGALGDGTADLIGASQAAGDEPVLRFLATRELGTQPPGGPDSRQALRKALWDQDPRVRETAALGLAKVGDAGAGQTLIDGAKQEPWPFVRRAEVDALGHLCVAGGGDLMVRATERDVDEVRRVALIGLTRCRDPRARGVLLAALNRREETPSLRALAAGLMAESGDRGAAPQLAAALRGLVAESEGDLALQGAAVAVLRALARLGGPEAVNTTVALAGDAHHPYRAPAIEALGMLCDPGAGNAALHALATGHDANLAEAAARAQKRCATK
ncbi:MAG TPA: HEAT repeat domain-containing protein [Polyangia bacterium]|nr:HEAT repeat domain-containing protein [Polyangia bacterium]